MLATTLAVAAVFHGTPVPPAEAPWFASLTDARPVLRRRADRSGPRADGRALRPGRRSGRLPRADRRAAPRVPRHVLPDRLPTDPVAGRAATTRARPASVNDIAVIVLRRPVTGVAAAADRRHAARRRRDHADRRPRLDRPGTGRVERAARRDASRSSPSAACHATYGAKLHYPALHLCTQDPTLERRPGVRRRQRQPGDGAPRRRAAGRRRRDLGRRDAGPGRAAKGRPTPPSASWPTSRW